MHSLVLASCSLPRGVCHAFVVAVLNYPDRQGYFRALLTPVIARDAACTGGLMLLHVTALAPAAAQAICILQRQL